MHAESFEWFSIDHYAQTSGVGTQARERISLPNVDDTGVGVRNAYRISAQVRLPGLQSTQRRFGLCLYHGQVSIAVWPDAILLTS